MKNVAVFGAGRIGRIHASNLAALSGVKLNMSPIRCRPRQLIWLRK